MNDSVRNDANTPAISSADPVRSPSNMNAESAGSLLRAAREKSGLHIAALAAALKVPVRKLEALEANRWDELTDATFTRALASSVARHLKADPVQVLAALPSHDPVPLVISDGLGKAASDHKLRSDQAKKPIAWAVGLLLLASVGMYFFPHAWPLDRIPATSEFSEPQQPSLTVVPAEPLQRDPASPASSDTALMATDASPGPITSSTAVEVPVQVAMKPEDTATSADAKAVTMPLMILKVSRDTWVEVTDNSGRLRIQRVVKAGEEVSFTDATTLSVVVGNAAGAQVFVRGQSMDISSVSKNNIARFEVK